MLGTGLLANGGRTAHAATPELDDIAPIVCHTASTSRRTPRFARVRAFPVADALADGTIDVLKPKALCVPATLSGTVGDPAVHWERYRIRGKVRFPTSLPSRGLRIVTATDTHVIDVGRPGELLVPTAVDPDAPVAPLAEPRPSYQCYAASLVSTTFLPGSLLVTTAAGTVNYFTRTPARLCLGVDEHRDGPHLLCYAVSMAPADRPPALHNLHTQTGFGPEQLDRRSVREVCLPALLDGVVTTTTTSTTIPSGSTTTTMPPVGGVLQVPAAWPTIQAAVDVAAPGAIIRVAPGTYAESIFITGAKNGLTIEAANPANPPVILGVVGSKLDGIRADFIDGLTLRNLRTIGAYDGVRLNHATHAVLEKLRLENSALGVRMNGGESNTLRDSTISVTRVEQGVWIEYSPDVVLERLSVTGGEFGGVRIRNSERARVHDVTVRDSSGSDGIKLEYSPDARVEHSAAHDGYARGFRILNSPGLVFADNLATGNQDTGIRLERSSPFTSVADVLAAGNLASGNGTDIFVAP
jgi:hypothetical protein